MELALEQPVFGFGGGGEDLGLHAAVAGDHFAELVRLVTLDGLVDKGYIKAVDAQLARNLCLARI